MMKFLLGKKQGMSQIFNKQGHIIPVTVIKAGPCFVTQIKTKGKDDYQAIQVGFEKLKNKKVKKPQKDKPYKYLREFPAYSGSAEGGKYKVGDKISVDIFKEGNIVKISSVSKGKGFQGVVKRHGFSGGPATHGHRHVLRTPGSIGSAFPERVVKGKKMPGRMGGELTAIKGLKVVKIDPANNLLIVKGAVPGRTGTLLEIKG